MWETARRSHALLEEVIARAHAAGALRADATSVDVVSLIRHFSRRPAPGPDRARDAHVRDRLLAIAMDGLRTPAPAPLPDPPPSWAEYSARWRHADPGSRSDRLLLGPKSNP
jgi:hypothetical protein